MKGKGGTRNGSEKGQNAQNSEQETEDFLEVCHDDSKFGGKSISSPVKTIEVHLHYGNIHTESHIISLHLLVG